MSKQRLNPVERTHADKLALDTKSAVGLGYDDILVRLRVLDLTDRLRECERDRSELLEACKAALADRFGGDDPCCDADPLTNSLRAAIAKAEGGAK